MVIAGLKTLDEVRIGDTHHRRSPQPAEEAAPGLPEVKPMVFSGLYPVEAEDYEP